MSRATLARLTIVSACILFAVAARAHDEGPPGFPCTDGPFGLPGLALPPAQIGEWGPVQNLPTLGIHATLLDTGKVLFWGRESSVDTYLWDPETGALELRPLGTTSDLFCAGHATLPDGRVLAVGGGGGEVQDAIAETYVFDPLTEVWTQLADLAVPRWYPTATILPDGRVLASGGRYTYYGVRVDPPFSEIYDPSTDTWTNVLNLSFPLHVYPPTFTLDDGKLLHLGKGPNHFILDVENDSSESAPRGFFGGNRNGASAMYGPGKVLKIGGDGNGTGGVATAMSEVLDLGSDPPAWRLVDSMAYPRRRPDLVLLPTGQALVVGGSVDGQDSPECAVHAPELWDPDTEAWTTVASMTSSRVYHSTALLLPDGRVLSAGGENSHTGGDFSVEVYSPAYLFNGPRPVVAPPPSSIGYGSVFSVETADSIASVALMRPGSVTHNYDESQRYLSLSFQPQGAGIVVTAPENSREAPPGFYMLFLVNTAGVPSVGQFVQLSSACNDGVDNDGDGLVDSANDPGCKDSDSVREDPKCDDDVDNDGDGKVDWDGDPEGIGDGPADPDPVCGGNAWGATEHRRRCGLGYELVLPLMALRWARRRRLRL